MTTFNSETLRIHHPLVPLHNAFASSHPAYSLY